MATSISTGHLYLIESDGTDNQNWLHDPDTIDLDNFTEPTDVCSMAIPEDFQKRFNTGVTITHLGGSTFTTNWNNKFYNILAQGFDIDKDEAQKVEKFLMSDRHTSNDETVFHQYYAVFKYATDKFWEFWDMDGNRREYCEGMLSNGAITWSDSESQIGYIRLNFESTF